MTLTILRISLQRLWNNKQELMLLFVVPIVFFSIFALIFSRGVGSTVAQVKVSFIDDDQSEISKEVISAACEHAEIIPVTGVGKTTPDLGIDRLARLLMNEFDAEVVVYIPNGFTSQSRENPHLSIQLYNEGTNPLGHRLVQASMAESIAMRLSEESLDRLPPDPNSPVTHASHTVSRRRPAVDSNAQVFEAINAFAADKPQPKIAMYAAGIAVMFLLFAAGGAGASLLEEKEAGTLERLLTSKVTLGQLLGGKWLTIFVTGLTQLTIMFAWGQLVFDVDLLGHLPGFAVMASATAAASASFAIFLATVSRSRQQLHGISIVLVLSMSAVGGSMVPRYIMSDTMRELGKYTFNGWALDGFQKVFWYDLPLKAIQAEVCVLLIITLSLGLIARLLANRWSLA